MDGCIVDDELAAGKADNILYAVREEREELDDRVALEHLLPVNLEPELPEAAGMLTPSSGPALRRREA